jgi:AraC-like DNA-binding protein
MTSPELHADVPIRPDWLFHVVHEFQRVAAQTGQDSIEQYLVRLTGTIPAPSTALEALLLRGLIAMARAAEHCDGSEAGDISLVTMPLVERAQRLFHERYAEPLTYPTIGDQLGCDPEYLESIFRKAIGETLHGYLRRVRVEKAMSLIAAEEKVEVAAYEVGFRSKSGLLRAFRSVKGARPSELLSVSSLKS